MRVVPIGILARSLSLKLTRMAFFQALQLRQLYTEQLTDLTRKCERPPNESAAFKATAGTDDTMVAFAELSISTQHKKPLLANLAVSQQMRRRGIGAVLVDKCEDRARDWGFEDILLQVEEDNVVARRFYQKLGYVELYTDPASRRYDAEGLILRNVRTSKITLQKSLISPASEADGDFWSKLDTWFGLSRRTGRAR